MNKVSGLFLAAGFFVQFFILGYFFWVQNKQNDLLEVLSSKLEKQAIATTETPVSGNQMVALNGSPQLSSEQIQSLLRDELTQFQNELTAKLLDENSLDRPVAEAAPRNENDDIATQEANTIIDELYVNALQSGQWSSEDGAKFRENLHMATEQRRDEVLDKLIIAINKGDITTNGRPIF